MAQLVENVRGLTFHAETMLVRDGGQLRAPVPDKYGFYENIPMAVLGIPTQNNTYYFVNEFKDQIVNPNSFFNKVLTDGKLYGEWGHPKLTGMSREDQLNRLSVIDEDRISHNFRNVRNGRELSTGGMLVVADIKPHGPQAGPLRASLDDPYVNTAFSLRGITDTEMRGGIAYRRLRKLVTFDAVFAGGYSQAAKRFASAMENLSGGSFSDVSIPMDVTDRLVFNQVALESWTDHELNDIFKARQV